MNNDRVIEAILADDHVVIRKIATSISDIIIVADGARLRACLLQGSTQFARALGNKTLQGVSGQIDHAFNFFREYFAGKMVDVNSYFKRGLTLDFGVYTHSEVKVYQELMKVPWGATVSYAELSRRAGFPEGARFAGNTMAKNLFPVIVPCHRVVHSDGSVGNFKPGIEKKILLLGIEGSFPLDGAGRL